LLHNLNREEWVVRNGEHVVGNGLILRGPTRSRWTIIDCCKNHKDRRPARVGRPFAFSCEDARGTPSRAAQFYFDSWENFLWSGLMP
jgi:hypothetical protein